ncbi:MAG: hypothetical protein UT78_C0024G0001 [Candidatus Nomurabacteria bacterium GW2011_GWF2_40_12]|uniref:Uncharacterized protein n=1 Tax=Candidatus Nomurabacteria bacterium GW2011_GWF2_40_12 TaxID=1618776 RepID=A0A0G0T322_9BACT|nr:MAG: hypothetical protein UT78_C0024G0001 [Candidatus Nomurabacteria bacterium GW2011_GWF2_40_12]OGJ13979.1 MAG: hypothetical protein A2585_00720 [Candidatus Nomurabacteria bacterium RIFOXYD1_FULL_39_12]
MTSTRIVTLEVIILAMVVFCFIVIDESDTVLWSGLALGASLFLFVFAEADQFFLKNINRWRRVA